MPPRYAYWTILIDNSPTAFRAAKREDLLPTFVQLQRTNPNIIIKWFARGRLWDTPEAEFAARRAPKPAPRSRDWRPGGEHKDPRARFDKRKKKNAGARPFRAGPRNNRRPR
jgi:hypothetical protein